eukprot:CAMPEP_0177749900 /NCGR_PEP_ID=MMETSP0484_2-20121128/32737_1 /TAXON_ID=354590 /ORGANISM="Rhodomonas lens, Strain RHODO" /LENGTH=50 /DNA_ID=CAMNT_0019264923 /DNA_START=44 /DNA_END=192 /DNA_ORIENTATION=-
MSAHSHTSGTAHPTTSPSHRIRLEQAQDEHALVRMVAHLDEREVDDHGRV